MLTVDNLSPCQVSALDDEVVRYAACGDEHSAFLTEVLQISFKGYIEKKNFFFSFRMGSCLLVGPPDMDNLVMALWTPVISQCWCRGSWERRCVRSPAEGQSSGISLEYPILLNSEIQLAY